MGYILVYLLLGYLALYLVIWSHEVAHAIMYRRYGCKANPLDVHVPLYLLFSTAAPIDEKRAQGLGTKENYYIGVAGIFLNLAFGIPLFLVLYFSNFSPDSLLYSFAQLFAIFHLLEATTYLVINNIFVSSDMTTVQAHNPGLRLPYFLLGLVSLTLLILLILKSPREWTSGIVVSVIVVAGAMGFGRVIFGKLHRS